jgi:hypothetical protein
MGRQIALVALVVVGGCATIVKGTDQQVSRRDFTVPSASSGLKRSARAG